MSREPALADPWAAALDLAASPRNFDSWQKELAGSIEAVVRPDAAGVFLCTLGNMLEATYAVAPDACAHLGERLVGEFLPRMHRAGLETPWELFAAKAEDQERPIIRPLRTEWLEPAGFKGLLGKFLRARDGMIAGWVAVFTRTPAHERALEIAAPLEAVCKELERTVRRSIEIAAVVGARFPKDTPSPLSDREREIASLAVKGFSDLNIAELLSISEGTVGRHLHNIYRKLGVSSRRELAELLSVRD